MQYRELGRTGWRVSTISFGTWAIGAEWGTVNDRESLAAHDISLEAVEELRALVPSDWTMAQMALRWILMFPEVTCAIPGAKRPAQVDENTRATDLPPLPPETMSAIAEIYNRQIRSRVHHYW